VYQQFQTADDLLKKFRYKGSMKEEILNIAPESVQAIGEEKQKATKRGRPAGQFDYHKLLVLQYLQNHTKTHGIPFEGTNEDLAEAIGEWGEHFRVGVSARQIARYLRKLQEETAPDGKSRIEVALHRFKGANGTFGSRRVIHVNDLRDFKVSHLDGQAQS